MLSLALGQIATEADTHQRGEAKFVFLVDELIFQVGEILAYALNEEFYDLSVAII